MSPRFVVTELVVADMAASLAFYRRLGLAVPAEADGEQHVDVELPGGQRISFDTHETMRSFDPDWTPPPTDGRGGLSLAFQCESPSEVDDLFAELTAAGYAAHHEPWDAFWGQRYAIILDPDGTRADLFASLGA